MKHQRKPVKPIYACVIIHTDGTGDAYFDDYVHTVQSVHGLRKAFPNTIKAIGIVKIDVYRLRLTLLKAHNYGITSIDDQPFWTGETIRKLLCFVPNTH